MPAPGRLRIGELSRRVGESPEVLRAWEARYGLVAPERTPGGLRLYSEQDERRVRLMRRHIDAGLSASEAARLAKLAGEAPAQRESASLAEIATAMQRGLDSLDEPGVQSAFDHLLEDFGLRPALAEVILPILRGLGDRWADGEATIAQEHFASNIFAGRLRALARGWGQGVGPRALLACPPEERHELGLMCFGLALREHGWRIAYLGADTPLAEIDRAIDLLAPAIVVLAATDAQRFLDSCCQIAGLARRARVGIAGAGAGACARLAGELGVEVLSGDLLDVAAALTP